MKRRILTTLTAALMVAMVVAATALPAFAQASENAGCVGQAVSTAATTTPPGTVGNTLRFFAGMGVVGEDTRVQTKEDRADCPPLNVQPLP